MDVALLTACRAGRRHWPLVVLLALAAAGSGCASATRPMVALPEAATLTPCRQPVDASRLRAARTIAWMGPAHRPDQRRLDAWCGNTSPPVIVVADGAPPEPLDRDGLTLVTWNVHAGQGDVIALVARLRSGALTDGQPVHRFVLLLQEAVRRVGPPPPGAPPDIVGIARQLGLHLYYVATQRLGRPEEQRDRGNAILSTEPLSGFRAIELPFVRQRRIAVEASVHGVTPAGVPWTMRVANTHLESTAPAQRLKFLVSGPRRRQAVALVDALDVTDNLIVGGDFNTWFGFSDSTYRAMRAALPDVAHDDRQRTFGRFFRLDHFFARLPDGWRGAATRLDVRFGSDHHPLMAQLARAPASEAAPQAGPD